MQSRQSSRKLCPLCKVNESNRMLENLIRQHNVSILKLIAVIVVTFGCILHTVLLQFAANLACPKHAELEVRYCCPHMHTAGQSCCVHCAVLTVINNASLVWSVLGLTVDGIYRVSGNMASVQKLRLMADYSQCYSLILEFDMWHICYSRLKIS